MSTERDSMAIHKLDVAKVRCRTLAIQELDKGNYADAIAFIQKLEGYERSIHVLLAPDDSYSEP